MSENKAGILPDQTHRSKKSGLGPFANQAMNNLDSVLSPDYEPSPNPVIEAADKSLAQFKYLQADFENLKNKQNENPLTGLPNKNALSEFVTIFDSRPYDIIATYIDLKNFGEINRAIGHEKADQKIREFGNFFQEKIRQSDLLFHLHGDEFVLLSSKRNNPKEEISPETGLEHHLQSINAKSEVKFDFSSVTFDSNRHQTLMNAINQADEVLMKKKETARDQKSQANFSDQASVSE